MIDYRAEPRVHRRRNRTGTVAAAGCIGLLLLGVYTFSGPGAPLFASPPDSTSVPPLVPDVELLQDAADSSRPETPEESAESDGSRAGLTVGERLKRLDSLMLVVDSDSLQYLMAEYEELLDSALNVRYGEPPTPSYARNRGPATPRSNAPEGVQPDTPRPEADRVVPQTPPSAVAEAETPDPASDRPVVEVRADVRPTENVPSSAPAAPQPSSEEIAVETASTVVTESVDPAPLRQRSNDGYVRSTPRSSMRSNNSQSGTQPTGTTTSPAPSTTSRSTSSARSTSASRRSNSGQEVAGPPQSADRSETSDVRRERSQLRRHRRMHAPGRSGEARATGGRNAGRRSGAGQRGAVRTERSSLERRYTEGLAKFRAGRYREAIELLRPVAQSGLSFRTTARYYLAVALERSGNVAGALRNYRALKGTSGSIGEKAWLGVARLLARSGETAAARRELQQFSRSRSGSPYSAEAKRMLRSLK